MTEAQPALASLASVGDETALNTELKRSLAEVWIDRDLGWLDFNDRVLAEALDDRTPLLERAKFLAIFTSNLDEFFMKRVALLRESPSPERSVLLQNLREKLLPMLSQQDSCFREQLIPGLAAKGVHLRRWEELTEGQKREANQFFDEQVSPALTPLIISSSENFPFLSNLSTSLVFRVDDPDTAQRLYARVKVPVGLSRWVQLHTDVTPHSVVFARLHEIMRENLHKLYPGMMIGPAALVRLTRDAQVDAGEGGSHSVLEEVREQVKKRRFEPVVRLEFSDCPDQSTRELLCHHFALQFQDIYDGSDDLDYTSLFEISGLKIAGLTDPPWTPVIPAPLRGNHIDIFGIIRAGDLLVHHPYESFDASVEHFVHTAANDPDVVSIKMTVYRLGDDTPFVKSLIRAAETGKQVACVIELKARFDEERNLHWASALEKAGAHVTFGVKGLKIHAKTALVVRKEAGVLRSYSHIGTGNYHVRTARLYADLGLFTCDRAITRDVVSLFHHLTGHSHAPTCTTLLVAPADMRSRFLSLIEREMENKKQGRHARIIGKMNQLEDPEIIEALCNASQAGVSVDLIIRGFCCLRPGVEGSTDHLRVRSIIGRFLEHSRIYYFANGAEPMHEGEFYIGSADWMYRNLSGRIEVVTPITAAHARQRLADILEICLQDRRQAWLLNSDATYSRQNSPTADFTGTHRQLMDIASRG